MQNVESLAHAALIARRGDDWYQSIGRSTTPGTALVTVSGSVANGGVQEIEYGTTLSEVVSAAGGATAEVQAVLLGGYFGGWASVGDIWDTALDPAILADQGLSFGCGLIAVLPVDTCGVVATARILEYMAGESARQCGPCIFGLGAIAAATDRLASGQPRPAIANLSAGRARSQGAVPATIPTARRASSLAPCWSSRLSSSSTSVVAGARISRVPSAAWADGRTTRDRPDPVRRLWMCAGFPEVSSSTTGAIRSCSPGTIPAELLSVARQAVDVCPVLALRLVAATSPERSRAAERAPGRRVLART